MSIFNLRIWICRYAVFCAWVALCVEDLSGDKGIGFGRCSRPVAEWEWGLRRVFRGINECRGCLTNELCA